MAIPLIVSLDFARHSIKVVHVHNMSQIDAVTREAGEMTTSDASSLPGGSDYNSMMLTYDVAMAAQKIQTFLSGE